jgi:hypothetical protein
MIAHVRPSRGFLIHYLFRFADVQLWIQSADVHYSVQQPHPYFLASHYRDGPVYSGTQSHANCQLFK